MTIRVAHLSDLHFGFSQLSRRTPAGDRNQREADVERAALLVADHLVEERPDVVVVAGDMLDSTRISTPGLLGARRFVHRFQEAAIPLIVIGGNHDQVESPIIPMLELLREDGAEIFRVQGVYDLPGLRLHLVPFRTLAQRAKALPEAELASGDLLSGFEFADGANLLVSHASVEGHSFRNDPVEVPEAWVKDERFAACLLGHIHEAQRLDGTSAFYAGALERLNFGERDTTPGFYLHTFADGALQSSDFVTVQALALEAFLDEPTPRPMLQRIVDANGKTLEDVDRAVRGVVAAKEVEGAIMKLLIHNVSSSFSRSQLKLEWQRAFYEAGGLELEVIAQTRQVGELLDVEFAAPPVHLGEAFATFLTEQDFASEEERAELIEMGRQVLDRARDLLVEAEG